MALDSLLKGIINDELTKGRDVVFSVNENEIEKIKSDYWPRRVDITANIEAMDAQPTAYATTYSVKIYAKARAPEGGHKC